ncbi:HAMP domain-containing protein [Streptococcus sp. zg-86]|uniref:histidine kinase n=1 Tax=Streptococcus zhangguiae TaxID=2664091 RepID=A0A6I4RJ48_9STRE|nr:MULTISPECIES: HAMP domain-containing sensor histidine kinase [unclassified Streptococcus]MTB64556.1 HAMP domain-containing protein [Streptococcus sp. zg-86]MTB90754.1 HAMP domain-containing protein [Streptococcus sp. zg-36]MWV56543.1 two-component sensor histidine kinase [Streptococcus sp. zg-70]QTH47251.1 HAMP domain-containing histidine kinase [Streptococcus sp. zg-86]
MKIAKKHFLLTSGMVFVVVTTLLTTLYFVMPIYYQSVKTAEVTQEFSQVSQSIQGKSEEEIEALLTYYDKKNLRMWYALSDATGKLYYPKIEASDEGIAVQVSPFIVADNERAQLKEVITDADGQNYTLEGEYSLQPVSDASQVLFELSPYLLLFSLCLGVVLSFIYSRISTKRLKQISATTRKMVSLSPDVFCQVNGNDEIADLAQDVNTLYESLLRHMEALRLENEKVAESERSKAEFLRMTSHELKTPIAGMLGIVDGMIYGIGDFKNRDKYLKKCREMLEEQSQLVQSILAISKLEMQDVEEQTSVFSLSDVLDEQVGFYQTLATVQGYRFVAKILPVEIEGNQTYLLKAIKNILDNAFHYTKAGGDIHLSVDQQQLIIENEAEKILSEEQIKQIFQPFYRPDYSRSRKDGGTGLGLFIVQQILDQHQLTYRFEAIDEKWMRFSIFF